MRGLTTAAVGGSGSTTTAGEGGSEARVSGCSSIGAVAGTSGALCCSAALGSGGAAGTEEVSAGAGDGAGGGGFRGPDAAAQPPSVLRPKLGLTRIRGRLVDIAQLPR